MTVIDLAAIKAEREPTIEGKARCIACYHQWTAQAPTGTVWLECESCHTLKGLFVGPCQQPEGGYQWRCLCGCDVFFITPEAVKCCQCGANQTGY